MGYYLCVELFINPMKGLVTILTQLIDLLTRPSVNCKAFVPGAEHSELRKESTRGRMGGLAVTSKPPASICTRRVVA